MNSPNQMSKVIEIARWKDTGELFGYGPRDEDWQLCGCWKFFHKNGKLWQLVYYNDKGERNMKTTKYFDELGNEF